MDNLNIISYRIEMTTAKIINEFLAELFFVEKYKGFVELAINQKTNNNKLEFTVTSKKHGKKQPKKLSDSNSILYEIIPGEGVRKVVL